MVKNIIKFILRKVFRYDTWSSVVHTSFGRQLIGERVLLIQRNDPKAGLFSFFITTLGWIAYAFEHGMKPVIDMATFKNVYQTKKHCNSWELFFDQPADCSLAVAKHATDVTIVRGIPTNFPNQGMDFFNNKDGILDYWRNTYRKYIRINETAITRYRCDKLKNALTSESVLGVLVRGTDYAALRPKGHPVMPTAEEMFDKIDSIYRSQFKFTKIFLVTEDEGIVHKFVEKYNDKLILSCQSTIRYLGDGYLSENSDVSGDIERGYKYLSAILDLSRCPYIVACRTSGAVATAIMADDESKFEVLNLGSY